MLSLILLSICINNAAIGHPVSEGNTLTPQQLERFYNWTEVDKENIWQLSGQFEGDMILTADQRNGLINTTTRWPNKTIPYMFDVGFTQAEKNIIITALRDYDTKTCIKPKLITNPVKDYVLIKNDPTKGCSSFVGRQGGAQVIHLNSKGCLMKGTILHEFLHALGFVHQQSSTERDNFVIIHTENIDPKYLNNFLKYGSNLITNFGVPYDYGSIMHYNAYAFSINSEKTIETKNPNAVIGQRVGFSPSDILKLKKMYKCP